MNSSGLSPLRSPAGEGTTHEGGATDHHHSSVIHISQADEAADAAAVSSGEEEEPEEQGDDGVGQALSAYNSNHNSVLQLGDRLRPLRASTPVISVTSLYEGPTGEPAGIHVRESYYDPELEQLFPVTRPGQIAGLPPLPPASAPTSSQSSLRPGTNTPSKSSPLSSSARGSERSVQRAFEQPSNSSLGSMSRLPVPPPLPNSPSPTWSLSSSTSTADRLDYTQAGLAPLSTTLTPSTGGQRVAAAGAANSSLLNVGLAAARRGSLSVPCVRAGTDAPTPPPSDSDGVSRSTGAIDRALARIAAANLDNGTFSSSSSTCSGSDDGNGTGIPGLQSSMASSCSANASETRGSNTAPIKIPAMLLDSHLPAPNDDGGSDTYRAANQHPAPLTASMSTQSGTPLVIVSDMHNVSLGPSEDIANNRPKQSKSAVHGSINSVRSDLSHAEQTVASWWPYVWRAWNALILGIQLFDLIYIPMLIAWTCTLATPFWIIINYLADICLLFNVCVMSMRPFRDQYGLLITYPATVRRHYFEQQWGWMKLLGSIPFDVIPLILSALSAKSSAAANGHEAAGSSFSSIWFSGPGVDVVSEAGLSCRLSDGAAYLSHTTENMPAGLMMWALLRATRHLVLGQFLTVVSDWQVPNIHVLYSRLVKKLLGFLWLSHVDACMFWLLCYREDTPASWINTSDLGLVANGTAPSLGSRWLASVYSAQQALFFSFRTTTTDLENLYCTLELLCGAIVGGSIFGSITNVIQSMDTNAALDRKAEKQTFRMKYLRSFMRARKFDPELQIRVRQHNELEWIRHKGMDEDKLFGGLPKSLRQEVCNHLYLDLVSNVPLFRDTDMAFRHSLTRVMRCITLQEGFYVFRQNDDGQEMYFVRSGEVEVIATEDDKVIARLSAGSYFGEIAIFEACRRTASVRTSTITELCVLTKDDFDFILQQYPKVARAITKSIAEKKAADRKRAEERKRRLAEEAANKKRAQVETQKQHKRQVLDDLLRIRPRVKSKALHEQPAPKEAAEGGERRASQGIQGLSAAPRRSVTSQMFEVLRRGSRSPSHNGSIASSSANGNPPRLDVSPPRATFQLTVPDEDNDEHTSSSAGLFQSAHARSKSAQMLRSPATPTMQHSRSVDERGDVTDDGTGTSPPRMKASSSIAFGMLTSPFATLRQGSHSGGSGKSSSSGTGLTRQDKHGSQKIPSDPEGDSSP
ncbi:hypothetical protein RI367_000330 [Sorochytrium milnesiophthora]